MPVYVTPTWFLVAALITWGFARHRRGRGPRLGPWRYGVSLGFAVLLYLSVLVHELSHTVVALRAGPAGAPDQPLPARRRLGDRGAAPTPGREAGIAVAGPLVSLLLPRSASAW